MKQSVFLISICVCLLLAACKKSGKEALCPEIYVNLEHIEEPDFKELFSEIEIIPLETDSTLINRFSYGKPAIYVSEKYYIVKDRDNTFYTFDLSGKFIADSRNCSGNGPGQFQIMQEYLYNPYRQTFEVLDPFSNIYSYTPEFQFLDKKKIKVMTKDRFRNFYPIDSTLYALFDDEVRGTFMLYDISKEDTIQTVRYPGLIERVSGVLFPFKKIEKNYFFIPPEINPYLFQYDKESYSLMPFLSVNGGDKEIKKEDFKGMKDIREVSEYISRHSSKYTPVSRLYSNEYLITSYIKPMDYYYNIYNLSTGKNVTFKRGKEIAINLPDFFELDGNVIYAIIFPDALHTIVDFDLVTNKNILDSIGEEDNPCVIKYTLKL